MLLELSNGPAPLHKNAQIFFSKIRAYNSSHVSHRAAMTNHCLSFSLKMAMGAEL